MSDINNKWSIYIGVHTTHGDSVVKNPPAMQEMQVSSLSWEDPLEKEMATHSSMPTWEIPWAEKSGL